MGLLSPAQWAKKQGFSRQYVHQLIQSGIISRVEGKIDEAQANAALASKRELSRPQTRSESPSSAKRSSTAILNEMLMKARIKQQVYKGDLLAMEKQEKMRELIPLDQALAMMTRICLTARDNLMNIPDRLQHELILINDAATMHRHLSQAMYEALVVFCEKTLKTMREELYGLLKRENSKQSDNQQGHGASDENE